MRTESLFGIALLGVMLLPGCAPRFNSAASKYQPAVPAAAMLSQGSYGSTSQNKGWDRYTAPITNSVKRGTEKIKAGTEKLVSEVKPKVIPAPDPTKLSTQTPAVNPAMHVSMAMLMERSGKLPAAEDHYKKALAMDFRNPEALVSYGRFLDRQGRLPEAVKQYELGCQANPQSAAALNDLGLCYARSNRLEEALQPLTRAIGLQPDRKLYRNNIATVLTELGRFDEAVAHFAAVHGPAVAHYNMGHLLQERGRLQAAADHFNRATTIDPSFAPARQRAGQLAQQGHGQSPAASVDLSSPNASANAAAWGGQY